MYFHNYDNSISFITNQKSILLILRSIHSLFQTPDQNSIQLAYTLKMNKLKKNL